MSQIKLSSLSNWYISSESPLQSILLWNILKEFFSIYMNCTRKIHTRLSLWPNPPILNYGGGVVIWSTHIKGLWVLLAGFPYTCLPLIHNPTHDLLPDLIHHLVTKLLWLGEASLVCDQQHSVKGNEAPRVSCFGSGQKSRSSSSMDNVRVLEEKEKGVCCYCCCCGCWRLARMVERRKKK